MGMQLRGGIGRSGQQGVVVESLSSGPSQEGSEYTRSRVVALLHSHGVSSRAAIARSLDLTPAAVTKVVSRLLNEGVVEETGGIEGRGGRRSIGVRIDGTRFHVIGVKFARSLVRIGVFDLDGRPLSMEDLPTVTEDTIAETISSIRRRIHALLRADDSIRAVGMAVPGPYLREVGRTAVVSSMQGWRSVNFLHEFSGRFPVQVFVEQDARAGVLAHHLFDPESQTPDLAYYLLGEGVGLGVLDADRLINGQQGAATEIGHVSVDVNGRPCECGNVGCLEQYCSAVAIHREVVERGMVPGARDMSHAQACEAVFESARSGEADAVELVRRIGRYVGYGCVTIINSYNPRRIVIGDIVAGGGEILLDSVRDVVESRAIPEVRDETEIVLSTMSPDAAVTGAAAVAIQHLIDRPSLLVGSGKATEHPVA